MFDRSLSFLFAVALSLALTASASAVETLKWEDLAPAWDDSKNPVLELTDAQQDEMYTILWGPNFDDPDGKMNDEERAAREKLKASGVDPDAIITQIKKRHEAARIRDRTLVPELEGRDVKLPGYVLPLEFSGTLVKTFLLVPYVGACIHVPPPPVNQIVHVRVSEAFESDGLFAPVWVTGRMSTGKTTHDLTLVDGTSKVNVGYALQARKIEPYTR